MMEIVLNRRVAPGNPATTGYCWQRAIWRGGSSEPCWAGSRGCRFPRG